MTTVPEQLWKISFYNKIVDRNQIETRNYKDVVSKYDELLQENNTLRAQNQQLKKENRSLTEKNTEIGEQITQLQSNGTNVDNIVTSAKLKQQEDKILNLHEELTSALRAKSEAIQQVLDASNEVKKVKEALKQAGKDHDATKEELKKAQETMADAEKTIQSKNNTIEVMKGEVEALKNDLKERDDRIKTLQDDNRVMIERVIDQKQKQVDAMNQVNELYRTVMVQKQQLSMLQAKYQQSTSQSNASQQIQPQHTGSSLIDQNLGSDDIILDNKVLSGPSSAAAKSRRDSVGGLGSSASTSDSYTVTPPKSILFRKTTDSQINGVVFSQDSQVIATAHNDKTVKLWNARSGSVMSTLYGSADVVVSVAISSNQQLVAGASADNICRIWTVGNGRVRHTLTGHTKKIYATDFSMDGKHVITGSHDRTIKVWELQYGTCEKTLLKCKSSVNDLEVCPNTPVFCSGHFDSCARLWDLRNSYALVHEFTNIHKQQITSVNFSRDGTLLLTAAKDNLLQIIDLRTQKILHTLKHDNYHNLVNHNKAVLSPCKSFAMSGSSSGNYLNYIWDVATEKAFTLDGGHKQAVTGCAWAPDGSIVASVSSDKQLVVYQ